MGLLARLFGRRRRRPAPPAGRHSRAFAGPSVPGSAASLVLTAATADALDTAVAEQHNSRASGDAVPGAVADVAQRWSTDPLPAPEMPAWSAPAPPPAASEAPVTLGFADGASVELPADDPRVRTFRAAAAALLDAPRA